MINPSSSFTIQCILNMLSKFLYVVQQILFYEFLIMFCCYADVDFQVLEDKDLDARRLKKTDFNSIINQLRVTPHAKLRLFVSLCRLVVLPLGRPILEGDVQLLETEFSNGYREGNRDLYVSIAKNDGFFLDVTGETISSWNQHWQRVNHRFEEELDKNKDLLKFKGKMFYV